MSVRVTHAVYVKIHYPVEFSELLRKECPLLYLLVRSVYTSTL